MNHRATVICAAVFVATLTCAAYAQHGMGRGMMGGGMMGGGMGSSGSSPSGAGENASSPGGRVETVCGFSGGNPSRGAAIYAQTCVACHGRDGHGGVPGAPDFARKGGVLGKPHAALQAHIKHGFSSEGSPQSMPSGGGNPNLTDQDVKDVHAYLHKAFGCG